MTKFNANQIKFDRNYLNELANEPNNDVFKQKCTYHLALHPAQLNDFGQSIKDELGRKIARYDELFQGIMLGFENIKLQSELGAIGPDNCYIHMDVEALFYVFRPEIGMLLKGVVTRTTKDHVGCLVYNTFNISLPKPPDDDGSWLGHNVAINSEVEFKITFVNLNARLPHIRGEIRAIVLAEGTRLDDQGSPSKSKKKHKKRDVEIDSSKPEKPKKKAKKEKLKKEEEDANVSLESLDIKSLFTSSSMDLDSSVIHSFADTPDKKKKRSKSQSREIYLDEVKLEADSDLEQILDQSNR